MLKIRKLALVLCGLMAGAFLYGQQVQPQGDFQQVWLRLEKELGLARQYAAEMQIQAMGMNLDGLIYRDGERSRSEMTMPLFNLKMVALQWRQGDTEHSYTLFPDKRKYFKTPIEDEAQGKLKYTLTDLGSESYEGVNCKKRRLSVDLGSDGKHELDILFSPAQRDMPVKINAQVQVSQKEGGQETPVNSTILFKNYRFGAQPATLFQLPSGYTEVGGIQEVLSPAALMGGMFGGEGGGATITPEMLQMLQRMGEAQQAAPQGSSQRKAQETQQKLEALRSLLGR